MNKVRWLVAALSALLLVSGFPLTAGSDDAAAFWALIEKADRLGEQQQHQQALTILARARQQFPGRQPEIDAEMAMLYAQLNQHEKSMEIWREGHAQGLFYGLFFDRMQPFHKFPQFQSLAQRDTELRERATLAARMRYEVVMPAGFSAARMYPLFIVLHGGADSIERAKTYWRSPVLGRAYLVAYMQSYRHRSSRTYTWQGRDPQAREGIRKFRDEIVQKYPVDISRVFVGGMSAGGMMSLDVVFQDVIPVAGFLVNCPVVPPDFRADMARDLRKRGVKGIVITGEKDWGLPRQKEMIDAFAKAGVWRRFIVLPGMGHQIPADFPARLDTALGELAREAAR